MASLSAACLLSTLFATPAEARHCTNKWDRKEDAEAQCSRAVWSEIGGPEYAQLGFAVGAAVASGGAGSPLVFAAIADVLANVATELAASLGQETATRVLQDLIEDGGTEFFSDMRIGYQTWNRSECLFDNCTSCVPLPNSHAFYVAWDCDNNPQGTGPAAGSLMSYHEGCNDIGITQQPDCMAATHRFCGQTGRGGAGLAQEIGGNTAVVACFEPSSYQHTSVSELREFHPGCDSAGKSQTPDCLSAIHRYCGARGFGNAGISQEVGPDFFGVACYNASWAGAASVETLRGYHGGCDSAAKSRGTDCVAAVHRFCSDGGRGGAGVTQEVGPDFFIVSCFAPSAYVEAAIR